MQRFVVLHHLLDEQSERETHWDLMLQHQKVLLTWALSSWPLSITYATNASRLPDHRMHYLTYEGPIAGRGSVTRIDHGTYDLLEQDRVIDVLIRQGGFSIQMQGQHTRYRIGFRRTATDDQWLCRKLP